MTKKFEDIGVTLLGPLKEIQKIKPYIPEKFGKDVGIVVIDHAMTFDDARQLLDESHDECKRTIVVEKAPLEYSTRYYGRAGVYTPIMIDTTFDEVDGLRLKVEIEVVANEYNRLWVNNTQSS